MIIQLIPLLILAGSFCNGSPDIDTDFEDAATGGCPQDWYKLDSMCYSLGGIADAATWTEARQWCSDNGPDNGDLATIYHPGLQSFLTAILKAFPVDMWVGLYTNSSDPTFQWADGAELDYTSWAAEQPDGGLDKCVKLINDPSNPGDWDDVDCIETNAFLCQSDLDPLVFNNVSLITQCEREDYQSYFDACFRVETTPMTFDDAAAMCQTENAQLASLTDRYQEAFVKTTLYNNGLESMWLGLAQNELTGDYTWTDGFPLTFSSWDMLEPSGEGCVALTDSETWNATHCEDMRPFVCKSTLASPPVEPTPTPGYCPGGWERHGDFCYLIDADVRATSWSQAEMACQGLYEGSHLVSVHSNAEKDFIKQRAGDAFEASTVWIGMDMNMDGVYEWSDESVVNYVNFADGQPGMGHCVEMDINDQGVWATDDCMDSSPYVCSAPVFDYEEGGCPPDWYKLDNSCFTLAGTNDPMTWHDAQQYCMENSVGDGNLATIYAAGLQSFLTAILKAFPEDVWIGLYTDGVSPNFQWSDGAPVSYTSWASGQPEGGLNKCVRMLNDPSDPGNWDDVACTQESAFLCQSSLDPNYSGNPDVISNCGRDGYQSYFDSCFRVETTPMDYSTAMATCQSETAQLAFLTDRYQEAFVQTVLYNNKLDSLWLGLMKDQTTGEYNYPADWPLTFTSWGMNEPSGEGCVALSSDETWDDASCTEIKPFVCKYTSASPPPPTETRQGFCPDGWDINDGFCYLFDDDLSSASWSDAHADCTSRYPHADLVSIHGNAEEEFVRQKSASSFGVATVWLGMDRNMDMFRWSDESMVNFVNWKAGQPGGDNCVAMDTNGGWSTGKCTVEGRYVCKVPVFEFTDAGCPPDWYKLDKKCYTLAGQSDPKTWEDARLWCIDNGVSNGNIATIYAAGLQSFLTAISKAFPVDIWIGMYTNDQLNPNFYWSDGTPVMYTNWAAGQPDGDPTKWDCVKMLNDPNNPGKWNDIECFETNAFLCQSDPDPGLPGNPDIISNCGREGYQSYFESCFRVETTPMTYDMAMATCHNESAQLASLGDRYQEAYAQTVLYNNRLDSMWIGLMADEITGEYKYQDGWPLTFTSWDLDEPSGEGCVAMTNTEHWDDSSCSDMKPFICKYTAESPPPTPEPVTGYCPSGWEQNDGFCYYFDATVTPASWEEASYECQSKYGASLASVHNENEKEFIRQGAIAAFTSSSIWIGMERYNDELFRWSDLSTVNYVNWVGGHPRPEDNCVEMNLSGTGGWNTEGCSDNIHYVCKTPVFDYNAGGCPPDWYKLDEKCYTLAGTNDPMTWQVARQYCMDNSVGDGDLATIYAGGLQSFLTAIMKAFPGDVWIGLYNTNLDPTFQWSDGSQVTYTSWADGQPDGDDGSGYCVKMLNDPEKPGQWDDTQCQNSNAFLCQSSLDPYLPSNPDVISNCDREGYQSYFDSCFRVETTLMTYDNALAMCENESASLASFSDRYQEAFAQTVLYNNKLESMWIGLKQNEMTGEYQYQDGWPLTFTSWGMNEPSGEGCVTLTSDEVWDDASCTEMKPFICKYTFVTPPVPPTPAVGYCPDDWEYHNGFCYHFDPEARALSWDHAQASCQANFGANLVSVHNNDELSYVMSTAASIFEASTIWIGMDRRTNGDSFMWSDTTAVNYVNWDGEPGTDHCVEMDLNGDGKWRTDDCNDNSPYVCKAHVFGEGGGCLPGWYKLQDRCYYLSGQVDSSKATWQEAKDLCMEKGGVGANLAAIQIPGIQSFLTAILKGVTGDVWIGLNNAEGGVWKWADGSDIEYENWAPEQPNSGANQCGKMRNDPDIPGQWVDLICSERNAYLCQAPVDPLLPGNPDIISQCQKPGYQSYFQSCFRVVSEQHTFIDAQAACMAEGSNLASLNDPYEEAFAEVVTYNNALDSVWLGLRDNTNTGQYEWLDGWPLTFTQWQVSEPSRVVNSNTGCVALTNNPNSTWIDEDCGLQKGFICKYTFVSPPADPPAELGYCPSGWELWQGHCYKFQATQSEASWDEAQYTCQLDYGSHLAYLHTNQEVEWVAEWSRNTWGAGTLWTGLRRDYESDLFQWPNQDLVDYVKWSVEPSMRESCVWMTTDTDSLWYEEGCETMSHYVCKMKQMGPVGGCPDGWYKLRDKCYKLGGGPEDPTNVLSWYDARETCSTDGPNGHLGCILNKGLQAFLTAILKGLEGDVWTGLSTVGQLGSPKDFVWDDGSELNYTSWGPGQPDRDMNVDNCVRMINDPENPGAWDDTECAMQHAYLCESDLDQTAPANPPIISRCFRDDYQSYISNCFKIVLSSVTFSEAEAACAAEGTQLAFFSDKYEQAFAQTVLYSNDVSAIWMGLSRDEESGHYKWTDDWPLGFTNWGVNEPSGESCVKFTDFPAWESDDCGMKLPYMCKFTLETKPTSPPPVQDGFCPPGWTKWSTDCYWVNEGTMPGSWEASHAFCQAAIEGSELLSIHSDEENAIIQEWSTLTWGRTSLWLGMNRNDMHQFEWSDDTLVDYVNWSPDEPNGLSVGENCVEFNSETGTWNDEDCFDFGRYICKIQQRNEEYPAGPTTKGPIFPPVEPTQPASQTSLSTGEIFGIAIACAAVALLFLISGYYLCFNKSSKKVDDTSDVDGEGAHPNNAYKEDVEAAEEGETELYDEAKL